MKTSDSKYILPTCAIVGSFFGVASIQYSLGLFFEAYGTQSEVLPPIVRLAWGIHHFRWLILLVGTVGLGGACWRSKSETRVNLLCGLYMLGWFILVFLVQFCLIYGLQLRR